MPKKPPKRPTKAERELVDLTVDEVSVVDIPANLQPFVILKNAGVEVQPLSTLEILFSLTGTGGTDMAKRKAVARPKGEPEVKKNAEGETEETTDESTTEEEEQDNESTEESEDDESTEEESDGDTDQDDGDNTQDGDSEDDEESSGDEDESDEDGEDESEDDDTSDGDDETTDDEEDTDEPDTATPDDLLTVEKMQVFKCVDGSADDDGDFDVILKVGAKMKQTRLSLLKKIHDQLGKLLGELAGEAVSKSAGDTDNETPDTEESSSSLDVDDLVEKILGKVPDAVKGETDPIRKALHDELQKVADGQTAMTETVKGLTEQVEELAGTRTAGNSDEPDDTEPTKKNASGEESVWTGLPLPDADEYAEG